MVNFYYVIFIGGLFFIAIIIILWDWLSNKKSKKYQTKHIRICPKCKSKDVKYNWQLSMVGRAVIDTYTCNKCSYTSRIFPETN